MDVHGNGDSAPASVNDLLRAVSHGLANRLLVIRCCAELAATADGESRRSELASLLHATDEATAVLRELAPAARSAAEGGADALATLADCVARLFPVESQNARPEAA